MATRNINLNAFTLEARQGRTRQPLDILGMETLVKLANSDSDGAAVILQQDVAPQAGPPLHRHTYEDEWFYVLQGELTVEVDGERSSLCSGGSVFAPRGTAHSFKNFAAVPARVLAVVTPGRFQQFFEDLSSLSQSQAEPDRGRIEQLGAQYGIEILGPPLS